MKKKLFVPVLFFMPFLSANAQSINSLFNDQTYLRTENAKALTIEMPSEGEMPDFVGSGNVIYQLETEQKEVNNQSGEFFVDNTDNIYPGAVVMANKDLANGDPTLAGLAYGKVTVSINFNTGGTGSRSGVTNSPDGIRKAINEILNEAAQNGRKSDVSLDSRHTYNSSLSSMVANLNVSASFLKAKAKVNASVSSKEISITEVEDYVQPYYTISITQESDKSKYFASSVTRQAIENKIRQFNKAPLAIITSVTYGRRAYHFKEFSSSDFGYKGSQSASGYGVSINSEQDIVNSTVAKKEWIYVTGSDGVTSGGILDGKTINKAMMDKVEFDPSRDQGVPISYKVVFLGSGRTATVTTTGKYKEVKKYVPCFKQIRIDVRKNASQLAGTTWRWRVDYKAVHVVKDANGNMKFEKWESPKCKGTYDGYADYREWKMSQGDSKKILVIPTNDLPDYQNCYVFGQMHYQIRAQSSANGSQSTWDENWFTPASDHLKAYIDGSNYAGKTLKVSMENE